ncbi:MAG: hypothetical protein KGL52_09955 [Rhodospirillales bacterium]|nr:hypothetical protein [Rhodospirillales bacterium]
MPARVFRRAILALPLLLAACGGGEEPPVTYPRLDYSYLPKLRLNVARVEIEQHFIPSDQPPSVSQYDPVSPTEALRRMGEERLKAFGTSGKAVFTIDDASLVRDGDTITGRFDVRLEVFTAAGGSAGFAEASVSRQRVGKVKDLGRTLFLLTRQLMDQMNVELEYQIRRSLGKFLVAPGARSAPVQAVPLPPTGQAGPATQPVPGTAAVAPPMPLVPVAPPVVPP